MRRSFGASALERVKIPRPGWMLPAAALVVLAMPSTARAQDVQPQAATHTVKRGDTLWDLAKSYLGDAYLWPEIYRINTDQIDDPHWIYPGEVLRLPGQPVTAAAPEAPPADRVVEGPRPRVGGTVFSPRNAGHGSLRPITAQPPTRVALGDVTRAPWLDAEGGPRATGRIMFRYDVPGIAIPRSTTNFQLFDEVLIEAPPGTIGAPRERFIAFKLDQVLDEVGQVVEPTAMLEVVRAAQNGEATIARVVELYTQVNAGDRLIPLDTAGAGSTAVPRPLPAKLGKAGKIRAIVNKSVLPSVGHFALFDLTSKDGVKIGDEVEIYRAREDRSVDEEPAVPEIPIASGQVVRVTPFGATVLVKSQEQPAVKVGESVRVTARMP